MNENLTDKVSMPIDKETFHKLLKSATANGVSDIHLREGEYPYFRMKGGLKKIKGEPLSKEDMHLICQVIIQDKEP